MQTRPLFRSLCFAVLASAAAAAQEGSVLDKTTPALLQPGSPTGSYALSNLDTVNLHNGTLNFTLPLLTIGGRGEAKHTVLVNIQRKFQVFREYKKGSEIPGGGSQLVPCAPGEADCHAYASVADAPWYSIPFTYAPGTLEIRQSSSLDDTCATYSDPSVRYTLTRLTFIEADGTEHELRDDLAKGGEQEVDHWCALQPIGGKTRGRTFSAYDGSGISFVAKADIYDDVNAYPYKAPFPASGELLFPSGVRYHFYEGLVTSITDRNGNYLTFCYEGLCPAYGAEPAGYDPNQTHRLTSVTDVLGRVVQITYGDTADTITFNGAAQPGGGATPRTIRINYAYLTPSGTPPLYSDLFPNFLWEVSGTFNPRVMTSVVLPDTSLSYGFEYNTYGELRRVTLPTGGAFEYSYDAGKGANINGEIPSEDPNWAPAVYRRVVKRREYDGADLRLETTYDDSQTQFDTDWLKVDVTHTGKDADGTWATLSTERHEFRNRILRGSGIDLYAWSDWDEGLEFNTTLAGGSRVIEKKWDQPPLEPPAGVIFPESPKNNPRVTQTVTTTNGLKTSEVYCYGELANRTDVYEYGFGFTGAPATYCQAPQNAAVPTGWIRRTHNDYIVASQYTTAGANGSGPHLRRIPWSESVWDNTGQKARTYFYYDNYSLTSGQPVARTGALGYSDPGRLERGNLTRTERWVDTDNTSVVNEWEYDVLGNATAFRDGRQKRTTYAYADQFQPGVSLSGQTFAFVTAETNPAGHASQFWYDYYIGRPTRIVDPNNITTTAQYYTDPLDRVKQVTVTGTAPRTSTYSYSTNSTTATRPFDASVSQVTTWTYDGFGREVQVARACAGTGCGSASLLSGRSYDGLGRTAAESGPYWSGTAPQSTRTYYDGLGRIQRRVAPDGSTTTYTITGDTAQQALKVDVTDPRQLSKTTWSDARSRIVKVAEYTGTETLLTDYAYDGLDNLISATQPGALARTFTYDSLSRLRSATNPESGTTWYEDPALTPRVPGYDGNGNLRYRKDADGRVTQMTYDDLNRVLSKTYSGPVATPAVTYSYDPANCIGRVGSVTSSASVTSYTCNADARIETSTQTTGGRPYPFSYGYNDAGLVTTQTYPSGRQVTTEYNSLGWPDKAASGAVTYASVQAGGYAAHGGVTAVAIGNIPVTTTYTQQNQTYEVAATVGAQALSWVSSYCPDIGTVNCTTNNGDVLKGRIGRPNILQTFTYDGVGRLTRYDESGGFWETYDYDNRGNRALTGSSLGFDPWVPSARAHYDARNRFSSTVFTSVQYGESGQMTRTPAGQMMQVDAENRLVDFNSGVVRYTYDGEGRRVTRAGGAGGTTTYVYDAFGSLAAEYAEGGTSEPGGRQWLLSDHLGSIRAVVKPDGTAALHDYVPFGQEATAAPRTTAMGYSQPDQSTLRFTGKERDADTGLDYFGARYFSGAQGRFTMPDWSDAPEPVPYATLADPQTLNLYAYVRNSPLALVDIDGHTICSEAPRLCAAVRDAVASGQSIQQGWANYNQAQLAHAFAEVQDAASAAGPMGEQQTVATSKFALYLGGTMVEGTFEADMGARGYGLQITARPENCQSCRWAQVVTRTGVGDKGGPFTDRGRYETGPLYLSDSTFYDRPFTYGRQRGTFSAVTVLGSVDFEGRKFQSMGAFTYGYGMGSNGEMTVREPTGTTSAQRAATIKVLRRDSPTWTIQ